MKPQRVLVTGAAGMLGSELVARAPVSCVCVGTDLAAVGSFVHAGGVDLSSASAVDGLWRAFGPFDAVVHGAAYTAVDKAETELELAERVNVRASRVLAEQCAQSGARLVAVSTDFVFDGTSRRPYREDDPPRPVSVYGRTKWEGEKAALVAHPSGTAIVRTQWLYGPRGQHFPRTIAKFARERGELKVVDDQVGCPTSTLELVPALWDVLHSDAVGIFHAACEGSCSWFGFTRQILLRLGLAHVKLTACGTSEFPRPAQRPAYSVLDCSALAALRRRELKTWRQALDDYLAVESL